MRLSLVAARPAFGPRGMHFTSHPPRAGQTMRLCRGDVSTTAPSVRSSIESHPPAAGLLATAPSTTTATHASAATATPPTRASTSTAVGHLLARLILWFRRIVNQQCVEGQRVWQNVVADGGASDVHGVELNGVLTLGGHLDVAQGRVHLGRDGCYGAVDDGAWPRPLACRRLCCGGPRGWNVPFLSSIVTVSFAHFIKNLAWTHGLASRFVAARPQALEERKLVQLKQCKQTGMALVVRWPLT